MEQALATPIQYVKGVGPKRAQLYEKLHIYTIGQLLRHYPRSYIDLTQPSLISSAVVGESTVIRAKVYRKSGLIRARGGKKLYKVYVSDGMSQMCITFFNNSYIADSLEMGKEYLFYGRVSGGLIDKQMLSPQCFSVTAKVVMQPVYPLTKGLSSKMIQANIKSALQMVRGSIDEPLSREIRESQGLCPLEQALRYIHFPENGQQAEQARKRLIFEELLLLQLGLLLMKKRSRLQSGCVVQQVDLAPFYQALSFTLTGAQQRAVKDCLADMAGSFPMCRLIQGDVGSGKTVVAAAAAYAAAKNGFQSAMMAPTEILSIQHFHTLQKLLASSGVAVGLLTGAMPAKQKQQIKEQLASGTLDIVVGTHALLQQDTFFHRLGLVITDEQHRFGVAQRGALAQKGNNPHVMVMSATPIPRSLALILYGDLDVSVIDEMPAGRKKIETYLIHSQKRERMFGFICKHIKQGRQAYIVCPLIETEEENEQQELADVKKYAQKAAPYLPGCRLDILHGKLKPKEKEEVMRRFAAGESDVLIATTVIEVGVDVPNAVIMAIENAERFGLSQLHQLRGRVGRGEEQSYCILISDAQNEETRQRLKVLCGTGDGFAIAREDLSLRGPGDFFGEKQHGLPALKIADMAQDMQVLQQTQKQAREILYDDPLLEKASNHALKGQVEQLFNQVGYGGIS